MKSKEKQMDNVIMIPKNLNTHRNDLSFDRLLRPKYKITYFLILISVCLQFISLLGLIITFIFPLWASFQITSQSQSINATNTINSIVITNVAPSNLIKLDMGIWEVKPNQELILTDLLTEKVMKSSKSMLWLDTGYSDSSNSFIYNFLSFIELSTTNIFIIQILEVLHLIFMFLSFLSTSLILCLCSNKLISPCWYLICFLLCVISFSTGLAVIILMAVWQGSSTPTLTSNVSIKLSKKFDWCFGLSIGVNCCLLLACLLILSFIIIDSMLLYKERVKAFKSLKSEINRDVVRCIPVDCSQMPRLQKSLLKNQVVSPFDMATSFSMLPAANGTSPSYLLNFGNGNYYKRNVHLLNEDDLDYNYMQPEENANRF